MSDDPNADIPLWVNVLVPTVMGLFFVATIVILFRTKKEIPVEKLEAWVEKLPLISGWFSTEFVDDNESVVTSTDVKLTSHSGLKEGGSTKIGKSHDISRYDSISTLKLQSDVSTAASVTPYYHASQGTLVRFESAL